MKSKNHTTRYARLLGLAFMALLGLSACGGGGGGSSDGGSTPNTGSGSSDAPSTSLTSPAGVTLTKDFKAKTIKVTWTKVPNATSYTVYRAEQSTSSLGENGFTNHSALTGHSIKEGVTATEYTLSNLTQGKTYYVLVQAVNDGKQSAYKAGDEKSIKLSPFKKITGYEGKCVIDQGNSLIWEVKQDDTGLHGKGHTYSWYNPDSGANHGQAGTRNAGTCYNQYAHGNTSGHQCDTTGFVNNVNAENNGAGLCGFTDWRMPTKQELLSLLDEDRKAANTSPMIDTVFFPNTKSGYWSSFSNSKNNTHSSGVDFTNGGPFSLEKGAQLAVRLVRVQLPAPKNLSIKQGDKPTKLTFTWQAVAGASDYMLYISKGDLEGKTLGQIKALESSVDTNTKVTKTRVPSSKLTHTLDGFSKGDTRYAVVTAIVNNIESVPSVVANGTLAFEKITGANGGQCVIDHKNNLMWEVKKNDASLHGNDHTYSWYNPDSNTNGGKAGIPNVGECYNKSSTTSGNQCDTTGFVNSVNKAGLCGFSDWRMPTKEELLMLIDKNRKAANTSPAIDIDFFPNTQSEYYWSSSNGDNSSYALAVDFAYGNSIAHNHKDIKDLHLRVRLVRDR